jgi:hypothetical protein
VRKEKQAEIKDSAWRKEQKAGTTCFGEHLLTVMILHLNLRDKDGRHWVRCSQIFWEHMHILILEHFYQLWYWQLSLPHLDLWTWSPLNVTRTFLMETEHVGVLDPGGTTPVRWTVIHFNIITCYSSAEIFLMQRKVMMLQKTHCLCDIFSSMHVTYEQCCCFNGL